MRHSLKSALLALAFVGALVAPSWAYNPFLMCNGAQQNNTIPTISQGTLVADAQGCITFDQSLDLSGRDMDTLQRSGFLVTGPGLPWGSTAPLNQAGATPTFTYTATALAGIENMTANVTSITLAGMTAGKYYTLILMQDGTGSRTLTQTSITGAPTLATVNANLYDVWLIKATSASAATFVRDYPNLGLWYIFAAQVTGSNSAVTTVAAAQAAPTVVAPGMSVNNNCSCVSSNPDAGALKLGLSCVPLTNAAQCEYFNQSAGSITPTAATINVRLVK